MKVKTITHLFLLIGWCFFLALASNAQVTNFPYSENFETGFGDWTNVGGDNFDWSRNSNGTPSADTGPDGAYSGSFYLYTEASGANNPSQETHIEATFDFTNVEKPELTFYYHMFGSEMGSLHLDVNDGVWNTDIWQLDGQQHSSGNAEFTKTTVDLTAFGGQNGIIVRFRGITGVTFRSDMAIDQVEVRNNCSTNAGNASSSIGAICNAAGGTTTLSLSGQDAGSSLQWQQSTDLITFSDIPGGTTTPFVTSTLSPSNIYYFRCKVVNGCTNYSDTVHTKVSNTNGAINSFPYSENFNSGFGSWSNVAGDDMDWTGNSGTTTSNNTGPNDDNTPGSFYLYTEASNPNNPNNNAHLEATFDFSAVSNPELNFYYHMFGGGMGDLYIDVNGDAGIWSISGSQQSAEADPYKLAIVDLSNYGGMCNVTLRFRGITGTSFLSDIAIDDISITDCAINPGNSSISTKSICNAGGAAVDLTLAGHSTGTTLQWQQSTDGVTFTNIAAGTTTPFTTPTLTPTSVYYFRCAVTNPSCTRYSDTVTTFVAAANGAVNTFPYTESFETGLGDWSNVGGDDMDWTRDDAGTPSIGTGPTTGHDGSFYMYTEASNTNNPNKRAFFEATFDFTGMSNPELSFFYHMYGEGMGKGCIDVNGVELGCVEGEQHASGSEPYTEIIIDLTQYAGECAVNIRMRGVTGTTYTSDMAFDYIRVRDACDAIDGGTASINKTAICNPSGETVDLSLSGQDAGASLQWQQSTDGISFNNIAGATTASFTTSTLTPNNLYRFRCEVTNGCNAYSDTVSVNVTASGGTILPPYAESFEVDFGDWSNVTGDDMDWSRLSGATTSNGTGPASANDQSFYIYTEASNPNNPGKTANLETTVDLSGLTNAELSFYYHMYGAGMGSLYLDVNGDNIWSISGQQHGTENSDWSKATIDLTAYAGMCNINLRLRGTTGTSYQSDIAVDQIEISYTCVVNPGTASVDPLSICDPAGGTATLTLSGYDSGTTLQWQQSTDGINFANISGATTTPYVTSNLTATNTYSFRCEVTGSCVSYSDTVTTYVGPGGGTINTFPYNFGFEGGLGTDWINAGGDEMDWSTGTGTTTSGSTGPSGASEGNDYMYTEASGANYPNKIAYLEATADFTSLSNPQLKFDYHMYGAAMGSLFLDINGTNIWSKTGEQHTAETDPFTTATIDLSAYAGECNITLRFRGETGGTWLSDMAIDNIQICDAPSVSTITGTMDVCTGDAGVAYSVTDNGDTYTWTITGGTTDPLPASGQGTASITVDWGTTGMQGLVSLVASNACTTSDPATDSIINVHSIAPTTILGDASVAEFTQDEWYKPDSSRTGYTYTWSITGGTLDFGQGSDSITVDWGAAGTGSVDVVASYGSCSDAPTSNLAVDIFSAIVSAQNGDWNVGSTWVGGAVPLPSQGARIATGHTVTLTANETIQSLTIDNTGILNNNGNILTVNASYLNNGTHTGDGTASSRIYLQGSGEDIGGSGVIENNGQIRVYNDYVIESGANLTINDASINIYSGVTINNEGNLTVEEDLVRVTGTPIWTNSANSILTIGGDLLLTSSTLNASASGNTISYNGSNNQTIKAALSNYYNLTTATNGTKSLESNIDIDGELNIGTGTTLDVTPSNFNINCAGDWNNDGNYTSHNGVVTFDGSDQAISSNAQPFYDVNISGTSIKTLNTDLVVNRNLTINSTLDISSGDYSITLKGDWNNPGTFIPRNAQVSFIGSTAQSIINSTDFNDVQCVNAIGVSITSGVHTLRGSLTLTNSPFNSNNALTLLSDANGTARIAEITGIINFTGDITMQRYISGTSGWKQLSSMITATTLGDWENEFLLYPCGSNQSIYTYNETTLGDKNAGYECVSSLGTNLSPGIGYMAWIQGVPAKPFPMTIDLTGPPVTGPQSYTAIYTDDPSQPDSEDGWNFMGNPYPSDVSWADVTKTNISTTAYIWDQGAGSYEAFNPGSDPNRTIPSMQGFWVKANIVGVNGSVGFNESDKAPENNAFMKQSPVPDTSLVLRIDDNLYNYHNATNLLFRDGSKMEFDSTDGRTFAGYIDISTESVDSQLLTINAMAKLDSTITIPVRARGMANMAITGGYVATATFTITAENLDEMPASSCILLEDRKLGIFTNLRVDSSYNFTITDTSTTQWALIPALNELPRFYLHIGAPVSAEIIPSSCNGQSDGMLILKSPGIGTWDYTWTNEAGTIIQTSSNQIDSDTLLGIAQGTYGYNMVETTGWCNAIEDTVSLISPDIFRFNTDYTNVSCYSVNNGSINLEIEGGTQPYQLIWNDGDTARYRSNLAVGTYIVTVADQQCPALIDTIVLTQPNPATSSQTVSHVSCHGGLDGQINYHYESTNTNYSYWWSNGETGASVENLAGGNYIVTIIDNNGNCPDFIDTVTVFEPSPIEINDSIIPVLCNGESSGQITITPNGGTGVFNYLWNNNAATNQVLNLTAGSYDVTLTDANNCEEHSSFIITEPPPITQVVSTINSACQQNNGTATLNAAGGTGILSHNWSNGNTGVFASNLTAGSYSIVTIDSNNCQTTSSFSISDVDGPSISISNLIPVSCFGQADGSASLIINSGTPTYTYLWSTGDTLPTVTGLTADNYTATVTDSNNCSGVISFSIGQPDQLINISSSTPVSCFGEMDGSIITNTSGGTSPYTYSWSNGSTNQNLIAESAGTYSITITDINGCQVSDSSIINEPPQIMAFFSCADTIYLNNGTATLYTNNGSSNATGYLFNFGDGSPITSGINPQHTYDTEGTYIVELTATNGICQNTYSQTVVVLSATEIYHNSAQDPIRVTHWNNQINVIFNLKTKQNATINLRNVLGQQLIPTKALTVKQEDVVLNLNTLPTGVYFVIVETKSHYYARQVKLY